jgi:4-amino-4-deoxy-L-arabinose transferase-like glycosyltransferase
LLIVPSILFGALFTLAVAWALGRVVLRRLAVPGVIALAVGAAIESCAVFLLLISGGANRVSFLVLGVICGGLWVRFRGHAAGLTDPVTAATDRVTRYIAGAALACFAVLYGVNALAPEVQPDAIGYHLGLVSEYLRLGHFPSRVGFYEMMPQGLEMLFVPAFAFGRHSAAKLVHFAFLVATVPLLLRIARRLHLTDGTAWAAAVLYFCAPVTGVSGTAAYNDAALVFFALATFYLLLVWRDARDHRYLAPAGVTAGFCYAIKMPGILVPLFALFFVIVTMRALRMRSIAWLAAGAALPVIPWMLRALIMTGNPMAPMLGWLFPNPYFHPGIARELGASLSLLTAPVTLRLLPYGLTLGGGYQGILGPAFLLAPVALLALRRPAGWLCWLAALALAIPFFWDPVARFLMPALPFLALAIAMALPKPAVWAVMALQAVACWPWVIDVYDRTHMWRLREFPLQGALRIEAEQDYLWQRLDEYKIARLIENDTRPGERVYALMAVATAYTDREVLEFWHTAAAQQLNETLGMVSLYRDEPFYDVRAEWNPRLVWGVRVRVPQAASGEWCIHDLMLFSGEYRIYNSPQWRLRGWPNVFEMPLAFDENAATGWRSREPLRAGMYIEADFDRPQVLSSAVMTSHTPVYHVPFEFYARGHAGWTLLTDRPDIVRRPLPDLRRAATEAIRKAGYRYILAPTGIEGNGLLGAAMAGHEVEWGLAKAGEAGWVTLYKIE